MKTIVADSESVSVSKSCTNEAAKHFAVPADSVQTACATLTKAHLADMLFDQLGMNKRESKQMVEAFFDLMTERLVDGHDVRITGFGNFQVRTKAPRPGRNPRTGETVAIGERRVVTFHASQKLKAQIQSQHLTQSDEGIDDV